MSFTTIKKICVTEQDLLQLAANLALATQPGTVIFLQGPLGAGKTAFSRGFLSALGHKGKVKSPTYTLIEQYDLQSMTVCHFDLYRIDDEEELEQMGIRDYFQSANACLIEWPEKGATKLPLPDIQCEIAILDEGRAITLAASSERGNQVLTRLLPTVGGG